jgi:hypothetical protein
MFDHKERSDMNYELNGSKYSAGSHDPNLYGNHFIIKTYSCVETAYMI